MKHEMLSDDVLISYADLWTVVSEGFSKNMTVILKRIYCQTVAYVLYCKHLSGSSVDQLYQETLLIDIWAQIYL